MVEPSGFDELDHAIVLATQAGLPLVPRPWHEVARQVGATPAQVMERVKHMLEKGMIRRIGAVPNHYAIGYRSNGMSVWDVDDSKVDALGHQLVHYCGGYRRGAVSADYFGHFSAAVETMLASDSARPAVVGIMSNGTSGDTGAFKSTDGKKFPAFEGMQFYGRMLAEEAIKSIEKVNHRSDITLEMQEREIELTVRRPDAQRIGWAQQVLKNVNAKHPHPWTKIYAEETLHLAEYPPTRTIKLQAIRVGDIGIAAAPSEVFAETGLAIKKQSPIKYTFNMELANGYSGYLPTREQHELGGYETWPARSSLLEVAAEEKIRRELVSLLSEVANTP